METNIEPIKPFKLLSGGSFAVLRTYTVGNGIGFIAGSYPRFKMAQDLSSFERPLSVSKVAGTKIVNQINNWLKDMEEKEIVVDYNDLAFFVYHEVS